MKRRVSEADRMHMARLGKALDEQLRDRRREAGLLDPGVKIERALRMSDELLRHTGIPEKATPVASLPALWRRRRIRNG